LRALDCYWRTEVKRSEKFSTSPDGRQYPFVLGFRTKDMASQQENDLKKADCLAHKKD